MADSLAKLIDCLGKATRLPDEHKAAIVVRARALEAQGQNPIGASRLAITEHLEAIQQDIGALEPIIRPPKTKEIPVVSVTEGVPIKRESATSQTLGAVASPQAIQGAAAARQFAVEAKRFVSKLPVMSDFRQELLQWVARKQQNTFEVVKVSKEINARASDPVGRAGITNFIEAKGDKVVLAQRAHASKKLDLRKGYQAAQNLTPEELAVAKKVITDYASLRQRAIQYGIDINEVQNYVNHLWDLTRGSTRGVASPKRLSDYFRHTAPRTFPDYFTGEQKGYIPKTKDIGSLYSIYVNELNNAINSRIFVQGLSKGKASDGRPLLAPKGGAKDVRGPQGKAYLIFPDMPRPLKGPNNTVIETKDYRSLDQPALRDWRWMTSVDKVTSVNAEGNQVESSNPVLMRSDLAVHPEIYDHMRKVLGRSGIRNWWETTTDNPFYNVFKGLTKLAFDDFQQGAKATMFGFFSPFHMVQEGTHAVGHMVNPLSGIPKIDLANNPEQIDAVRHGLMLAADRVGQEYFMDGLGTNNKDFLGKALRKFAGTPGRAFADLMEGYSNWLFEAYIPGLKFKTYQHILARNMNRFQKELKSGNVNTAQVKYYSAKQADAAYGSLNYADMGRSPTAQHLLQIIFVAPDFSEARGRFTAQAAKGLAFQKTGYEQLRALSFLALTMGITAQVLNYLLNGETYWKEHPFEVKRGNRLYRIRFVPGDIVHLLQHPGEFASNRLASFSRLLGQWLFHVNWRGEKTDLHENVKDMLFGIVPLPLQFLTRQFTSTGKNNPISPWEQIAGSSGFVIHRYSPISEIYPLAKDWQQKNAPNTIQKGRYPVSKYQQLRYALEDGDQDKALAEFKKLREEEGGMTRQKIEDGFKESIFSPFTGSMANDQRFYRSLNDHDRLKFDAAIKRRVVVMNRFQQWLPHWRAPVTERSLKDRMRAALQNSR